MTRYPIMVAATQMKNLAKKCEQKTARAKNVFVLTDAGVPGPRLST